MGLKGVTRTGSLDGGFEIGGAGVFGLSQYLHGGGGGGGGCTLAGILIKGGGGGGGVCTQAGILIKRGGGETGVFCSM